MGVVDLRRFPRLGDVIQTRVKIRTRKSGGIGSIPVFYSSPPGLDARNLTNAASNSTMKNSEKQEGI